MRYFSSLSLPHITMYSLYDTWLIRWVVPFGNLRIKVYSRLPRAYRSVLRPSSPSNAKASTKCPYYIYLRQNLRLHDACRVIFTRYQYPLTILNRGVFSLFFNFTFQTATRNIYRPCENFYIHIPKHCQTLFKKKWIYFFEASLIYIVWAA